VELLNAGEDIIIVDNLSNSSIHVIDKIKGITGKDFKFYEADLLDKDSLREIFKENNINIVMHFAGLKSVGESVSNPLLYYHNNVTGTITLCEIMAEFGVKKLVFSSSATVYGNPKYLPINEKCDLSTTNPYGSTKLMIENILQDIHVADNDWSIAILRYFNPVGAHSSWIIGENPKGIPNNLMPYISQVAAGKLNHLRIFGNDYDTHDGTGVRDYIHVVDLAKGHLKAMYKILKDNKVFIYNLGTGQGYSVLDMVKSFEKINGVKIKYNIVDRRPGDIANCYADPMKAKEELDWVAEKTIDDMCKDAWGFTKNIY
jgi:UDP-glucose 4-epimerase